ncbi:ubiquitin C-terminal hydrolase Ubp7 [Schizosaccharomyces pombe]|uniref:Probable ubiquitin carboxyl-terminal hydrolase 7 n=1 Tax=Schizosaccharomyces pombe (strain 972 / ATCC 24843) TaxID=284812 RepID=UBP7_SCHPO|nr:ubiquitin hydrolase Ubp7 [Schizosaccharomyces pombe]Q9P7S5.1 RecName: Full=Probable ubiquitin carboxyl-terminal hydrolase 7; AltName: Full=Deubiquitinating enzyme 7; AltName: Full=Ubiquitin thioesterase 7; AltName: Full=Ubiquitin-specific-processing protease 7 [Schizosaccharomyces pombe 972h-]CAB72233.1 ubiquitin C-terminal hydrolase Ubp7 [Schizosaccharomyces pombe]|eukprot:NP_593108.1 ubiquitin hydrolase Ubp7 [Schizosaccharomyces pombe]
MPHSNTLIVPSTNPFDDPSSIKNGLNNLTSSELVNQMKKESLAASVKTPSTPPKECSHLKKGVKLSHLKGNARALRDPSKHLCFICTTEKIKREDYELTLCANCGYLFCCNHESDHSRKHFEKNKKHCVFVNIITLKCHCYSCDADIVIFDKKNLVVRDVQQFICSNLVSSLTKAPNVLKSNSSHFKKEKKSKHSSGKSSKKYKVISPGLKNLGATCFFNSTLQVLCACEALHDVISPFQYSHSSVIVRKLTKSPESSLLSAFIKFLETFYKSDGTISVYRPTTFFGEFRRLHPQFSESVQQDAHELLRLLLDDLISEEFRVLRFNLNSVSRSLQLSPCLTDDEQLSKSLTSFKQVNVTDASLSPNSHNTSDNEQNNEDYVSVSSLVGSETEDITYSKELSQSSDSSQHQHDSFLPANSSPLAASSTKSLPSSELLDSSSDKGQQVFKGQHEVAGTNSFEDPNSHFNVSNSSNHEEASPKKEVLKSPQFQRRSLDILRLGELSSDDMMLDKATMDEFSSSLVIKSIFTGRLTSVVMCQSCNEITNTPEPIQDLSIPIHYPSSRVSRRHRFHRALRSRFSRSPKKSSVKIVVDNANDDTDQAPTTNSSSLNENLLGGHASENDKSLKQSPFQKLTRRLSDLSVNSSGQISKQDFDNSNSIFSESSLSSPIIEEPKTLIDCLKNFTHVEELSGENMFACENCCNQPNEVGSPAKGGLTSDNDKYSFNNSVYRNAYKRMLLDDPLPPVFIIHLKRFFQEISHDGYANPKKISDFIEFEQELDLNEFVMPHLRASSSFRYRLFGVIVHSGTLNYGHYVAYVLSHKFLDLSAPSTNSKDFRSEAGIPERRWLYISDNIVRESSWDEVSKVEAYMLFYERV